MKCVAIQFDPVWENPTESRGRIVDMLARAGDLSNALVVLPEMAESGFTNNPARVADGKSELFACAQSKKYGCYLQHGFAQACGDSFVNMVARVLASNGLKDKHKSEYEKTIERRLSSNDTP